MTNNQSHTKLPIGLCQACGRLGMHCPHCGSKGILYVDRLSTYDNITQSTIAGYRCRKCGEPFLAIQPCKAPKHGESKKVVDNFVAEQLTQQQQLEAQMKDRLKAVLKQHKPKDDESKDSQNPAKKGTGTPDEKSA